MLLVRGVVLAGSNATSHVAIQVVFQEIIK